MPGLGPRSLKPHCRGSQDPGLPLELQTLSQTALETCGEGAGPDLPGCCFCPHLALALGLFPPNVLLQWAVFECTLPGGCSCVPPPPSEERSFVGPQAGLSSGWGAQGELCVGVLLPCFCLGRWLWLLCLCGYLLQVALCQTHSVTHTCTLGSPPRPSPVAFQCAERKQVSLGVKFALIGWGVG